jgi:hypothetical protein
MAAVHPFPVGRRHAFAPGQRELPPAPPRQPLARSAPLELAPTIFHEHWWLDAATGGAWQAAEVRHQDKLVGWMPYVLSRRRGFDVSVMPPLAHLLGPVIDEGNGSSNKRWLRRLDVLAELVEQLPRVGHFSQTCHPGVTDVLGFQACGFDSSVQFSAEIPPSDAETAWRGMRDKTRNVIRRAQDAGRVERLVDPDAFAAFYQRNLAAAGQRSYIDTDRLRPLYEAARSRDQAAMFSVRDEQGAPVAAVFYVWDRSRLWYFLSSRSAGEAGNGAVSLLVWEGIQEAGRRGLVFDFDGIASPGAARFFAGFGAQVRPRLAVHRSSTSYALLDRAIALVRGSRRNHFTAP